MVSLCVDIAIGPIQARGNFEFFDVISRFNVARLPWLHFGVS